MSVPTKRVALSVLVFLLGGAIGAYAALQFKKAFEPPEFLDPFWALQTLEGVGPTESELREIHAFYYLTPWGERYETLLAESKAGDSYATLLIGELIGSCSSSDKDVVSRWAREPETVMNIRYPLPRFLVGLMAYRRESCRGIEDYFQENEYNTFFREEGERWRIKAAEAGNPLGRIPRFDWTSARSGDALIALQETHGDAVLFALTVERVSRVLMPEYQRFEGPDWSETLRTLIMNYSANAYLTDPDINAWLLLACFYSQHHCDLHDYLRGASYFKRSDFQPIADRTIEIDRMLKAADWDQLVATLK